MLTVLLRNRRNRQAALAPQTVTDAAPVRMSSVQKSRLIRRGDKLYRLGDLVSARLMYQQVAATGDGEAALSMGRTFDPIYFDKLGVQGFDPEPETAMGWYSRAKSAGLDFKADEKIRQLNQYLNQ